jgi:hypothetical protein
MVWDNMEYDAAKHHRRSIRLPGRDYRSPGADFVTICVQGGQCLVGEVMDGEMRLNEWEEIAWNCWQAIPEHFPHFELDAWVVMPNHLHGIIAITGPVVGAQHAPPSRWLRINLERQNPDGLGLPQTPDRCCVLRSELV